MKNLLLTIILGLQFVFLSAQNSDYKIAERDGKLYYNRNLPVYLWISKSPNNQENDVLMTSERTKSYANPMYFDSEGYNTFQTRYACDSSGKNKGYAIFKVYVDGMPPQVSVVFLGTRHYSAGKYYYEKGLEVKITAKDYNSGVDKIYYTLNGDDFKEYTEPVAFDEIGEYTLKCYAEDITGNKSLVKTYKIMIK